MPIDTHVHLRDEEQKHKETIKHGLEVAFDSGVHAIFDMPNTARPVITKERILNRLKLAKDANVPGVFYGLYLGLTNEAEQVKQAVDIYMEGEFSPYLVGMKLYAGHSVGNLGVTRIEQQEAVYETLSNSGYSGVLVVHCEKESYINRENFDPKVAVTHCHAQPEKAEIESVKDQIRLARKYNFPGKLHIAHISSPIAVGIVNKTKKEGMDISSAICPHHFIYDWRQMNVPNGIFWKMNPPLREYESREKIFKMLRNGEIDWIETDHAPHTLDEKIKSPFMSGIPGLAWWPLFIEFLSQNNFSGEQIERLTFSNAAERFGVEIKNVRREIKDRRKDYPFDPYEKIAQELEWPAG